METLPEKLQKLTEKRYFAYIAVIVFAFITALIFALIAFQSSSSSVEDLRHEALDANRTPAVGSQIANSNRSVFDRIIDAVTGRKPVNQDGNDSQASSSDQNGSNNASTNTGRMARQTSGSSVVISDGDDILKKIEEESAPLPQTRIGKYVLKTDLPTKPNEVKIHQLKTNYSEAEVFAIARNFGLTSFTSSTDLAEGTVLDKGKKGNYQMYDLNKHLYLGFDAQNGSYIFIAENGITAPSFTASTGADPRDAAEAFMQASGMMQPCLKTTDAYESSKEPGTTIVEMRCDWDFLGAPLFNTVGVLNLADNSRLNSVKLGDSGFASTFAFEDSQQKNGDEKNATDFNTVLITVDSNGRIKHIGSNVLPIEDSSVLAENKVISPQDAYAALTAGKTRLTLASPAGSGYVELDKIFPNGFADTAEASVNDFVLAYSVIPGINQNYLCPKWISRSTGQLSSGYDGLFVSTMQAVNDSRCSGSDLNSSNVAGTSAYTSKTSGARVAGVSTSSRSLLAQGNPIHVTPTGPAPTVSTGNAGTLKLDDIVFQFEETPALGCPEAATFTNSRVLDEQNGIYMMWAASQQRTWYIVFTQPAGLSTLESSSGKLNPGYRADYLAMRAKFVSKCSPRTSTSVCPMPQGLTGSILSCVLLTTGSPSIYVHSQANRNLSISVQPLGGVGYADPSFGTFDSSITWNLLATAHSLQFYNNTSNGAQSTQPITRNRAYYEFRRNALLSALKTYGEPTTGYVLPQSKVVDFVQSTLAPQIGLNQQETTDLTAEFKRELSSISSTSGNVRISLLPAAFVNKNLKLEVNPQPTNTFRYIFYVSPTSSSANQAQPTIKPIIPSDYYVVETGVLAGN